VRASEPTGAGLGVAYGTLWVETQPCRCKVCSTPLCFPLFLFDPIADFFEYLCFVCGRWWQRRQDHRHPHVDLGV